MQKLAIFGDSYARKDGTDISEKSWHEFIEGYDVTNYGEPGTDLWFSYSLFLKHHKNFEKIIFLVTAPHRITLSSEKCKIYPNQNYTTASIKLESATGVAHEQYKALVDYYELIHNKDKEEYVYSILVDNINKIRPDVVVYPCFDNTWSIDIPLYDITRYEDGFLGITDQIRNNYYRKGLRDSRACHMTEANNRIVADLFVAKLSGLNKILTLDYLVKPANNVDYYYQSKWH